MMRGRALAPVKDTGGDPVRPGAEGSAALAPYRLTSDISRQRRGDATNGNHG